MDDAALLRAVLQASCALDLLHGRTDVVGDCAVALVGRSRTEDSANLSDLRRHLFGGKQHVEIAETALDFGNQVISAYDVRTGLFSGSSQIALGENGDFSDLSSAMRQGGDAAHVLVTFSRVDAEVNGHVDTLHKLGGCRLFYLGDSGGYFEGLFGIDAFQQRLKSRRMRPLLYVLSQVVLLWCSRPCGLPREPGLYLNVYNSYVLEVSGLGKRYGDRWLFRNLSFSLQTGDALIVLGRNGSGKSTLLRTLAGLLVPSEGKVKAEIGDNRIGLSLSALEMSLYPALTLREHLRLAADLRGCEAREEALLERIGLTHAADLAASKISTGMKGRLKLALAIQPDPSILILDEPGAGLDEPGKRLVQDICEEQKRRGVLVLATNDIREKALGTLELELAS